MSSIRRSLAIWRRAGQLKRGSPIAEGFTLASKPPIQKGNTSNSEVNRYKILHTTNGDRKWMRTMSTSTVIRGSRPKQTDLLPITELNKEVQRFLLQYFPKIRIMSSNCNLTKRQRLMKNIRSTLSPKTKQKQTIILNFYKNCQFNRKKSHIQVSYSKTTQKTILPALTMTSEQK